MKSSVKIATITLVITQIVLLLASISAAEEGKSVPRAKVTTDKQFITAALKAHNQYRSLHQVSALSLSDDLCKIAQAYANKLAANDKFELIHSKNGYGENLYWSSGKVTDGNKPVNQWCSERTGYNYTIDYQSGTGHFTQVVWKATKEMGIAKATGKFGTYVVANYNPRGNVVGTFTKNVFMD